MTYNKFDTQKNDGQMLAKLKGIVRDVWTRNGGQ